MHADCVDQWPTNYTDRGFLEYVSKDKKDLSIRRFRRVLELQALL
jgi:hypothetical protein